jgi:hypothetical protein
VTTPLRTPEQRAIRDVGTTGIDVEAAADAVTDLMRALGMDPTDPSLARTPQHAGPKCRSG